MIIICPNCESRYLVQSAAIGQGKKVRCASCTHLWYQAPDDNGDPAPSVDPESVQVADADDVPAAVRPGAAGFRAVLDRNAASSEGSGGARMLSVPLYSIALLALVFAGMAGGLAAARQQIVAAIPGMEAVYGIIGAPPALDPSSLVFDALLLEPVSEGIADAVAPDDFILSGQVINLKSHPQILPMIEISPLDRNGVIVSDPLRIGLGADMIEAEGVVEFEQQLDFEAPFWDVEVKFVLGKADGHNPVPKHGAQRDE